MTPIPPFDIDGVIPPVRPGAAGVSADRAPHATDLLAFCERFGTSSARWDILDGLLRLRAALRAAGIADGFQWLDGSFAEDVERLRGRPPADIDVVTFAPLGDAAAQRRLLTTHPHVFDNAACKAQYRVDHYVVGTDRGLDAAMGQRVTYWYSLWAHQRGTQRWKGFVSVPLRSKDAAARAWIERQVAATGGTP